MRFERLADEIIARTGAAYFAEMLIGSILAITLLGSVFTIVLPQV